MLQVFNTSDALSPSLTKYIAVCYAKIYTRNVPSDGLSQQGLEPNGTETPFPLQIIDWKLGAATDEDLSMKIN